MHPLGCASETNLPFALAPFLITTFNHVLSLVLSLWLNKRLNSPSSPSTGSHLCDHPQDEVTLHSNRTDALSVIAGLQFLMQY